MFEKLRPLNRPNTSNMPNAGPAAFEGGTSIIDGREEIG